MIRKLMSIVALAAPLAALAATSEITVGIKLDNIDFVVGESIGAVVNIVNISPDDISVGYADSADKFFIEVFRSKDMSQLQRINDGMFVAPFLLKPNEGQIRAFDVVPGMRVANALQMFANHEGLRREFELIDWSRNGVSHLFLTAKDGGTSTRGWQTVDLGDMMKVTRPTISVMSSGEVVVLHRLDPDNFLRSEFWSVPAGLVLVRREIVQDPETAGSQRVRELYQESGGIKPKKNPWWKFW